MKMMASLAPLIAGVVAIGVCSTAMGAAPDPRPGASTPVEVINTPANPVPVTLQGTSSVTGSVTVTNTPNVNVVNRPLLQPFVHSFGDLGIAGSGNYEDESALVFTVPAGKRLVLEDVAVSANMGAGQQVEVNLVRIGLDGAHNRHGIPLTHQITSTFPFNGVVYSGGRAIRMYLAPGEKLTATARRNIDTGGASFIDMFVYGYFVDIP